MSTYKKIKINKMNIILCLVLLLSVCANTWSYHLNNDSTSFIQNINLTEQDQFPFEKDSLGIKRLKFINCKVTSIPHGIFTKLRNLEYADFSECQITTLSQYSFSAAYNLRELILSHNNLSELTSDVFQGSTDLIEINLAHNKIALINNQAFRHLKQLKILNLSHNKLNILPPNLFINNQNLEIIDLSHNFIATINDWKDFVNLQYLNLNFNRIHNISMSDLNRIQNISLNNNQLELLKPNRFVQVLHANHNQLTNSDLFINDSVSLTELSLTNNSLTNVDFIKNLANLTVLNLSYNPVKYDNKSNLFANLKNLKTLNLKSTNLSQMNFEQFCNLRKLETLDISYNDLFTIDFEWLGFLENLRYLNINGNILGHMTFEELEYLFPNLNSIAISDNNWQCGDLKHMLKRLKHLNLKLVMEPSEIVITTTNIRGIECTQNIIRAEKLVKRTLNSQLRSENPFSFNNTIIGLDLKKINLIQLEENKDHIRRLKFNNSQLSYIPLGIFENFGYLEYADFSHSKLEVLARYNFSSAFNLRELTLSHNNILKLESNVFDGANNLVELKLAHNQITIIECEAFKYLPKLSKLDLSHNKINILPSDLFSNTPNIKVIDLSNNLIETINHWDEFNNLQYLNFNFNRIHNISIVGSNRIQNISLNNNKLKILKTNRFVQVLHADNNHLTNANMFINESVSLTELSLTNNFLMSLNFIENLTNLSYINLSYNPVKHESKINYFSNLNNLKTLILKSTNLNHFNFEQISELQNLESLDISNNDLVTIDFDWLGFLENLRYLNINNNNLGHLTFDELEYLFPNLNSIAILDNNWRCDDLKHMLKRLKHLNLKLVMESSELIRTETNVHGIRCSIERDEYIRVDTSNASYFRSRLAFVLIALGVIHTYLFLIMEKLHLKLPSKRRNYFKKWCRPQREFTLKERAVDCTSRVVWKSVH